MADCLDESLYHRAWTLQERVLSPRLLIYTQDQVAWDCQSFSTTESGYEMHGLGLMRLPGVCSRSEVRDR